MRRLQKKQFTVTCNATNNTVGTLTLPSLSGKIVGIKIKSPAAVDLAATLTTTIADADGDLLPLAAGFTGQAVNTTIKQYADTQTQPNPLQYPVAEALALTCTLNQNQTVTRSVLVTLYIDSYL